MAQTSPLKAQPLSLVAKADIHLPTLEQILCRERSYVRHIPPPRPSKRFMLSSPVRKRSFYNVNQPVPWPLKDPTKRRPRLLRRVMYEERVRDIMHRVTRTTYSYKTKYPALATPEQMYTCCPRKGF